MKSYPSIRDLPLVPDQELGPTLHAPDNFAGMKSTDRAPRETILHRAYAIWQSEGYPENRHLANWLEAEAEVIGRA